MLVTESEFMLLEPDKNQLGYGIVKFIAFLQVHLYMYLYTFDISLDRMLIFLLILLIIVLYSSLLIIEASLK